MKDKIPYKNFDTFILRSPVFPFNFIDKMLSARDISEEEILNVCRNPVVDEALFLASPDLHTQLHERINGKLTDPKKVKKLHYALMRYILRMSNRPTPFGLFAGFCVGKWDEETQVELAPMEEYSRHTRLDMNYLCALALDLAKHPIIKEKIKYFPNSSIYAVGNQLRYVEYRYLNARRTHHIVAVDNTEYLNRVLEKAYHGAFLRELSELLVDDEITMEESQEFIEELIRSQVLVNELEPAMTGPEFLDQILEVIKDIEGIDDIRSVIHHVQGLLQEVDSSKIGSTLPYYSRIANDIKPLNTGFELKYLFQTDMVKPARECKLDIKIVDEVLTGMEILNRLSARAGQTNLTQFRDAFVERYETKEIPLLQVLDTEAGIGYRQTNNAGDVSPLVDDLMLPGQQAQGTDIRWTPGANYLLEKYHNALKKDLFEVEILDSEVSKFQYDWNDLPDSFSTMVHIVEDKTETNPIPRILMTGFGGSSAGNLLGRFCHADPATDAFVKEITQKEAELHPDAILAEIIHLNEARVGNVILRPVLRPYEIPYLAKAAVPEEFQIKLDDLMVSVKGNRVVLRSKRLNKEIIPHLTNAHNFSFNALPVYQFLAELQTQNLRGGMGFNWGPLSSEMEFLPRVIYKNLIFSPAKWSIKKPRIEKILEMKDDNEIYDAIQALRKELKIPAEVLLADADNKLYINLENLMCIKTLFSVVRKRPGFELEEFIFNPSNAIVKSPDGIFTNEFVFSFYKTGSAPVAPVIEPEEAPSTDLDEEDDEF